MSSRRPWSALVLAGTLLAAGCAVSPAPGPSGRVAEAAHGPAPTLRLPARLADEQATPPAATPVQGPTTPPATSSDPASSGPTATTPRAPRRTATLVMSGDLLWHNSVWASAHEDAVRAGARQRFDFDPMFASLRPLVAGADVAICHEEVPFAAPGGPLSNYPVFAAPPQIAAWIGSMGWDACTTDSNHSLDQGYAGLVRTATLLERAGVRHVGTFRSRAERQRPVIVTTDRGVRVGIVGGTYSLNGFPLPAGRPWAVSMWQADTLLAQAHRARAAGADVVVVQLHGGDEYSALPNADQVALARRLTASPDVDLVFAEHAHVVQPITRMHGKWVVYGMGNMVAQNDPGLPRTYEGISVSVTFAEDRGGFLATRAAYVPTYWTHYSPGRPVRVLWVDRALARGVGDRARLLEARAAIRAAVHGLGPTPGLVER